MFRYMKIFEFFFERICILLCDENVIQLQIKKYTFIEEVQPYTWLVQVINIVLSLYAKV